MDPHSQAAEHVQQALAALRAALLDGITATSAGEITNLIMTAESVISMLENDARLADALPGFV